MIVNTPNSFHVATDSGAPVSLWCIEDASFTTTAPTGVAGNSVNVLVRWP